MTKGKNKILTLQLGMTLAMALGISLMTSSSAFADYYCRNPHYKKGSCNNYVLPVTKSVRELTQACQEMALPTQIAELFRPSSSTLGSVTLWSGTCFVCEQDIYCD